MDAQKSVRVQQYLAIKNAFNIIYSMAIPAASPDIMDKLTDSENYLLMVYGHGLTTEQIETYTLTEVQRSPTAEMIETMQDYQKRTSNET